MKIINYPLQILVGVILLIGLNSCHIEKRRHRKGYHILPRSSEKVETKIKEKKEEIQEKIYNIEWDARAFTGFGNHNTVILGGDIAYGPFGVSPDFTLSSNAPYIAIYGFLDPLYWTNHHHLKIGLTESLNPKIGYEYDFEIFERRLYTGAHMIYVPSKKVPEELRFMWKTNNNGDFIPFQVVLGIDLY